MMEPIYPKQCEFLAAKIFELAGYHVDIKGGAHEPFDLIAYNQENVYFIEVKSPISFEYRNYEYLNRTIDRIEKESLGKDNKYDKKTHKVVLLVFSLLKDDYINDKESDTLIILDLGNLLKATENTPLYKDIISILPFYINDSDLIKKETSKIKLNYENIAISEQSSEADILKQLDHCRAGRKDSVLFERICSELLKQLFSTSLSIWKSQVKSNNDLYQFDLICKIKSSMDKRYYPIIDSSGPRSKSDCSKNKSENIENDLYFWPLLERYFNSKYVIFEFKNYSSFITQREVYTTEKYLYDKALRNVAIIISRNGFDRNATIASRGILREHGKLIIDLTIDELRDMLDKNKEEDPSETLENKLDAILIDLEK